MILIKKGKEPRELQEYRCKPGGTFDDFQNPGKEKLRNHLLKEQGYICAYCMKTIDENSFTKIEHYRKRNDENQLLYTNLLAVCDGNEHHKGRYRKQDLTCDSFKGKKELAIHPCKELDIKTISYNFGNGAIMSCNATYDNDLNSKLNLNHPQLMDNRKAALRQIKIKIMKASKQGQSSVNKTTIYFLCKSTNKTYCLCRNHTCLS